MGLQIFLETGQNVMEEMQNVRYDDFEVGQSAEIGETDTGKLVFDDPGGVYNLIGWRRWRALETTASPTLIASGRIMARTIKRGDADRGSLRTGADRLWDCDACDENILLGIRVIRGTAANRPAETAGERLAWLLSTSFTTLVDNGHITYPTDRMDAHDYTGENDKDLIASCATPGGYNYFAVKDGATSTSELFFMLPSSSSWQSTISISNDIADVNDVTCFEANYTAEVRRTPERIAQGVFLPYSGGDASSYVYVNDTTIGDQYAYVDKTAPMAEVHTSAKATVVANRLLADSDEEDDRIIGISIAVPAAQVNALRLWHRVQVKLTHVPGYAAFRWCRVLHRAVRPEGAGYRLTMDLTPVGAAPADCTVLSRDYTDTSGTAAMFDIPTANTPSGFYPYNSTYGNDSDYVSPTPDGRVFYMSAGGGSYRLRPIPGAPATTGWGGGWTAAGYGISAPSLPLGTADTGGSNPTTDSLEIIVVGPGTMTLWATHVTGATYTVWSVDTDAPALSPWADVATVVSTGAMSNPSTSIVVPDDGFCMHAVVVTITTEKMYYGGHDWLAAT